MSAVLLSGPDTWTDAWTIVASVTAVVIVVVPFWWRVVRPRYRKAKDTTAAVVETLVGRGPVVDKSSGQELAPATPGLGVRMASMEAAIVKLSQQDERLTVVEHQVVNNVDRIDANTERIGALERATQERIATRAENAAAMGLMAKLHDEADE